MPAQPGPNAQTHMHLESQPSRLPTRSISIPAGTPGQLHVKLHSALSSLDLCKGQKQRMHKCVLIGTPSMTMHGWYAGRDGTIWTLTSSSLPHLLCTAPWRGMSTTQQTSALRCQTRCPMSRAPWLSPSAMQVPLHPNLTTTHVLQSFFLCCTALHVFNTAKHLVKCLHSCLYIRSMVELCHLRSPRLLGDCFAVMA